MKKGLLLIAAIAMSTLLYAQQSDVEELKTTVAQSMNEATTVSSSEEQAPQNDTHVPQNDKNDTQKEAVEQK